MSHVTMLRRLMILSVAASMIFAASAMAGKPTKPGGGGETTAAKYVALGDSFSTGYQTGGSSQGGCGKVSTGYPYIVAQQRANTSLTWVACDGAVTGDIPGQASSITSDTNFVTVTIGGNDVGFANLVLGCVTFYCQSAIDSTNSQIKNELPAKLDSAYSTIKSKSNATVIVLGYARFFGRTTCTFGISSSEQTQLNAVADNLDAAVKAAAGRAGFTYKSAISSWGSHDVCASDPWLDNGTFHPTASGHSNGYVPMVRSVTG